MPCTYAGRRDGGRVRLGGSGGGVAPRREEQTWWSLPDLGWATASGSLLGLGRGRAVGAGSERSVSRGWLPGSTLSFCYRGWLGRKEIGKCGKSRIALAGGSAHDLYLGGSHIAD